ncbi:MAG: DUF3617 family protein [Gammaproteobacteria bacterium]|nr:DUF3617 family protein [Gammaproteobacteria bacterium]
MRITTLTIASLLTLSATNLAIAGNSISIETGLWEVTTTMTSPMFPQPRVNTQQECMEDSQISPESLAPSDDGECSIIDSNVSGNTLNWSMQCNTPGGAMTGQGSFNSNGDSGSGNMQMNMDIQGQSMSMQMEWKGRRIGSC